MSQSTKASPSLYVNLSTANVEAGTTFFTALGFSQNTEWSDKQTVAFFFPAPNSNVALMLSDKARYQTFIRPGTEISDASKTTEVIFTFAVQSKDEVDAMVAKAVAAGGKPDPFTMPENGEGFGMYCRSFEDPDGHIWEANTMLTKGDEK
ncbi:glyoxalase-like domain-containing protein [Purpureocillium lavendulum]|uniref:Glyoxalase-like domain-containing protein n=1 Tax=Purpureocillium lavendulum TaxID=1247861 RepID=A0AB34G1G9_9HYPO|nr:glyoxalase-like domain-containing protein [Purpureocillium lavendulum]